MRALEVVGQLIESRIAEVFSRHGLSHAAGNVLAVIEGSGGPMSAGDIGSHMHITSGSVTSLLDTLERRELVRRFDDPGDRRRVLVDITPECEGVLDDLLPLVIARAGDLAEVLSADEKRTLLGLLVRVEAHARALDREPTAPHGRHAPERLRPKRAADGRRIPPQSGEA